MTATTTSGPATYRVQPAADRIGISRRTIDVWINRNVSEDGQRSWIEVAGQRVPVLRIGRRWVVVAAPLESALRGEAVAS